MVAAVVPTVIGILGNIASFLLFLSPVPTFWRIWKKKSTEDFSGLTYVITLLNCALWVLYGERKGGSVILVLTINGIGLGIEFIYTAMFIIFASSNKRRLKMLGILAVEAVFIAALALLVILLVHKKHIQIDIFGWVCVALNIAMYWAPLSAIWTVYRSKSVEYMPFFLTLMVVINSILWFIWALLKNNIYVLIPNLMGVIGGLVQLGLYWWYHKTPQSLEAKQRIKDEKEAQNKPRIEMV